MGFGARILVEFIGLEKLGSGDRFCLHFPFKKALRVFDPWGPLNIMMQYHTSHSGIMSEIDEKMFVQPRKGIYKEI